MLEGGEGHDVVLVEIGGTVGDIESLPFLEVIRQMAVEIGGVHTLFMHLTLVLYMAASGEVKTNPTQHSVKSCSPSVSSLHPDLSFRLCCSGERTCEDCIVLYVPEKSGYFSKMLIHL